MLAKHGPGPVRTQRSCSQGGYTTPLSVTAEVELVTALLRGIAEWSALYTELPSQRQFQVKLKHTLRSHGQAIQRQMEGTQV